MVKKCLNKTPKHLFLLEECCLKKGDQFFGAIHNPKDTSEGCQKGDVPPSVWEFGSLKGSGSQ
jgi:hypothetical protein